MRNAIAFLLGLAVVTGLASSVGYAHQPGPDDPEWHLSKPIVKQVTEIPTFLHRSGQTTFATLGEAIDRLHDPLIKAKHQGKVAVTGPTIFIYEGITDHDAPFTLSIGNSVANDEVALEDYENGPLAAVRVVSFYYTGSYTQLHHAYEKIIPAVIDAGHAPAGQTREVYLFHEGKDSPNNVVEIQIVIRPEGDAEPDI